jgi:hypothetical protein
VSDASGTDARLQVDPSAEAVELASVMVDISELDWETEKRFAKQSYAEKWVHDVDADGAFVQARFFFGSPDAIGRAMDKHLASPDRHMLIPKPGGFATAPGGHQIQYARLVFDDEADPTFGCLFLSCHPPQGEPGPAKPWTLGQAHYVLYGKGGQIVRGTTPG